MCCVMYAVWSVMYVEYCSEYMRYVGVWLFSVVVVYFFCFFFFQAEDGIRDAQESRGLGDVYKRQV